MLNPLEVTEQHFVVTHGIDCDGQHNPSIFGFDNEVLARDFADVCNDSSDGISHEYANKQQALLYYNQNNPQ
jgi:hypothetical protein